MSDKEWPETLLFAIESESRLLSAHMRRLRGARKRIRIRNGLKRRTGEFNELAHARDQRSIKVHERKIQRAAHLIYLRMNNERNSVDMGNWFGLEVSGSGS